MGTALDDEVTADAGLAGIHIPPDQMLAAGGMPASPSSRVYGHAQLAVQGLRDLGLDAAPGKVAVGCPVIGLGFLVDPEARRIRCPALKRASMLADVARQRDAAASLTVDRADAGRLVGRLCNMSQVLPELWSSLHGGYAVSQWTASSKGRRHLPPSARLAAGSDAQLAWLELLDLTTSVLTSNEGVDIAPERTFPAMDEPGVWTVTTDASGTDGVGGYVFCSDQPDVVWLVSEPWDADARAALDRSASSSKEHAHLPSLSMPAAELFGSIAVAEAVSEARGIRPTAVYAVGDCDPAAYALNAAASGNAQIRCLLKPARDLTSQWLAVSVPREMNVDADRLSHPTLYSEVAAAADRAELLVRRAHITSASWRRLTRAAAMGTMTSRIDRPTDLTDL